MTNVTGNSLRFQGNVKDIFYSRPGSVTAETTFFTHITNLALTHTPQDNAQ